MREKLFLLALLFASTAHAASPVVVDSARLRVGQVIAESREPVAAVDLGPAPPPGGSRLLARQEITDAVRKAGLNPAGLRIPQSVRVTAASRTLEPLQIEPAVRESVVAALPRGVTLTRVESATRVVISPRAQPRLSKLPPLPRQKGPFRQAATVEWVVDDRVVASSPVMLVVDISEQAATPDVRKGAALTLVVQRGQVQVSAAGVSHADGMVGDVIRATVTSTHRVVRARLIAKDRAKVME